MAIKVPIQYPILGVGLLAATTALMTSPIVGRVNKAGADSIERSIGMVDSVASQESNVRAQAAAQAKKILQTEMPGGVIVAVQNSRGGATPTEFNIGDLVTVEESNGKYLADTIVVSEKGKVGRTDQYGIVQPPASGMSFLPQLNPNDPEVRALIRIYSPTLAAVDERLKRPFITPSFLVPKLFPDHPSVPRVLVEEPTTYETRSPQGGLTIPGVAPPSTPAAAPIPGQPTDIGTPQPSMAPTPATTEGVATPAPVAAPAPATPQALPTPTAPTSIPTVVPPDILPAPVQTPTPYKPLGQ